MRSSTLVMIGLVALFGPLAVVIAETAVSSQAVQQQSASMRAPEIEPVTAAEKLLLRRASEVAQVKTRRVALKDLGHEPEAAPAPAKPSGARVVVTRGSSRQEYTVPRERWGDGAGTTVGRRRAQ